MTVRTVLADRDPGQALHNGKPPFQPNASKKGFPAGLRVEKRQNPFISAGRAIPKPRLRLSNGSAAIAGDYCNQLKMNENISDGGVRPAAAIRIWPRQRSMRVFCATLI
jgi:hypothetical protein